MSETRPFHIAVPEERLAAIRRRVQRFPWDDMPVLAEDGNPWSAGASHSFMREVCDYWVDQFDWRAQEVAIDGVLRAELTLRAIAGFKGETSEDGDPDDAPRKVELSVDEARMVPLSITVPVFSLPLVVQFQRLCAAPDPCTE